jgi:hypothetical protein
MIMKNKPKRSKNVTAKMKLKDFTTAFTGLNATRLDRTHSPDAQEVKLITGQSIDQFGLLDPVQFQSAWIDTLISEHLLLRKNDVVVQIRGNVFKTGLIRHTDVAVNMDCLASSNFAILRVDENILAPEIVVAYLNSTFFKNTVIAMTRSNTLLITLKALLEQSIAIPTTEEQTQLVQLFYSYAELQKKTLQLFEQQAVVAETRLLDALNGATDEGSAY